MGLVVAEYKRLENFPDELPQEICVDSIGMVVLVCVTALQSWACPSEELPLVKDHQPMGRHICDYETSYGLRPREWFEQRDCRIPEGCEELVAELSVPSYHFTSVGKMQVGEQR